MIIKRMRLKKLERRDEEFCPSCVPVKLENNEEDED